MLKETKNRGAGLVTVVVVLAVASILLAGAVLLSFAHYKNVIRQEMAEQELAEIELCVDVLEIDLKKNIPLNSLVQNGSFASQFYSGQCSGEGSSYVLDKVVLSIGSATIQNEEKTIFTFTCGETVKKYELKDDKSLSEVES